MKLRVTNQLTNGLKNIGRRFSIWRPKILIKKATFFIRTILWDIFKLFPPRYSIFSGNHGILFFLFFFVTVRLLIFTRVLFYTYGKFNLLFRILTGTLGNSHITAFFDCVFGCCFVLFFAIAFFLHIHSICPEQILGDIN